MEGLQRVTGDDEFKQIFATLGEMIAKDPKLARPTFAVLDEFEAAAAALGSPLRRERRTPLETLRDRQGLARHDAGAAHVLADS